MSDTVNPEHDKLAASMGINVQPPPMKTGNPSAHDLLIEYFDSKGIMAPPVDFKLLDFGIKDLALVYLDSLYKSRGQDIKEEILKRKEFGLKKYGTPLTTGNGRDHYEDGAQELIDFLVYYICAEVENGQ
ncbi:hypothetical protein PBI_KAMPE_51 [Gordonia phage Kampe]|uniref:Uncharacterized protein n=3 Tax=Gordonia phage Orchid TaxID=1838075 RepID=A0A160DHI4_9CAUD|nr:hypothetical protein BH761_gp050 [Gordonia phage Orchid]ANA87285.1 hypothetical protein PBI_PATRICKSTAR_51 [Gordonia phage PatrickStar]ANA87397.1 hypothetical protein PBI_ORCHID_50 [Gordonia phage Orchid]ANA87512.1 hypothetical protein PBI_KAMPE_51 [Gordonia phage Kampe]AXH46502.1 hypothetical protein SEA_ROBINSPARKLES_54 [Gordonia phage RobinSparkles]